MDGEITRSVQPLAVRQIAANQAEPAT
jgi:hypothetical protein